MPVEKLAERGFDTLRFGPMKPVGITDPATGQTPYAVVQLRQEDVEGTMYNMVGFQTKLKWDNLVFGDMIDPNQGVVNPTSETPPDNSTLAYPDFDAGLSFSYKGTIYGGVAVHHLTEPNNAFYAANSSKLYMKFTVHGGVFIDLTGSSQRDENYGSFSVSPNFLYMQQDNFHQLNVGLYVNKKPFIAGAWFRHNFENADAIVPMIGLEWRGLKVGYSYDITLSQLKSTTGGAHEVSLGWQFNCMDQKRRRIKAINCPRF